MQHALSSLPYSYGAPEPKQQDVAIRGLATVRPLRPTLASADVAASPAIRVLVADGQALARVPHLVEFIEANEPRLIAFNEYVSEAGDEVTVVQVHPDAASMEAHMEIVRARAGGLRGHARRDCSHPGVRPADGADFGDPPSAGGKWRRDQG